MMARGAAVVAAVHGLRRRSRCLRVTRKWGAATPVPARDAAWDTRLTVLPRRQLTGMRQPHPALYSRVRCG